MSNEVKLWEPSLYDRIQDMTEKEHTCLSAMHALLREMKEAPRSDKYDPVQFIEDIEYTMQGIWGFSRDRDYHIHWMDVKGCTCSKIDNREAFGAPFRYIDPACPHHAQESPF